MYDETEALYLVTDVQILKKPHPMKFIANVIASPLSSLVDAGDTFCC